MRRSAHLICVCVLLGGFLTSSAAAQTPEAGTFAAGGDLGVFFPDEAFEKTFTLDAFGEYYVVPNVSIRGFFGWANPGFENFTEDKFRQVKLLFNGCTTGITTSGCRTRLSGPVSISCVRCSMPRPTLIRRSAVD